MKVSLVAGLPTPLSAVHLYHPWSCLLMIKGKLTKLLSESLVQVMLGTGLPSAEQFRVTSSPSFTIWFPTEM